MNDDFYGHDEERPAGADNLFLWTVGILLLIGLTLAIWLGSFYIFGHPEKPESYRILQKLKKLEPPKRFELTEAPPGEFLTPQKAYEKYANLSAHELKKENQALLHDYIKNYDNTKRLVPYIVGRYSIMNSYTLKEGDFFGSGVVAVGQSVEYPQTVIEHVYTAGQAAVPVLEQMLAMGLDIKLDKTSDLAAIIHVERMFDGRMQFTVVPLIYGSYALKQGSGNFSLEPPPSLNPEGGLPIIRGALLQDCVKTYAEYLRNRGRPPAAATAGGTPAIPVAQPAAETTIVQVETPPRAPDATPTPAPTATPAVAKATPEPPAPPVAVPTPPRVTAAVSPTPTPARPEVTPPPPTPTVAVATPPPPAVEPGRSPLLQPFLVASATPGNTPNPNATWRVYPPGRMPRGRLVDLSEAADLADRGTSGERLYLRGDFVVTATMENRAALRADSTFGKVIGSVIKQRGGARVIVEFPAGETPPAERSSVSRDERRPFEIRDVRRGADGQVNIYVREVTAPQ